MFEDLENKTAASSNQVNNPNTPLLGSMPSEKIAVKEDKTGSLGLGADESDKAMEDFEERVKGLYSKGQKRGKRYSLIGIVGSIIILVVMSAVGYYLWSQVRDISKKVETREQDTINLIAATSTRGDVSDQVEEVLAISPQWTSCVNDDDCIETQTDCCSCQSGGTQTAINKNYLVNWQGMLDSNCQDAACLAVVNCIAGKAICDNGLCTFSISEASSTEPSNIATSSLETGLLDAATAASMNSNNIDSDNDGLTDEYELIYGTDKDNPDTDGDSYKDGDEVKNGYNPLGAGRL